MIEKRPIIDNKGNMLTSRVNIHEIESGVDHNHSTTRQFQHMTFYHEGVWFVFYSDGKDFHYQTSDDSGRTWQKAEKPVDTAPNGSSSFDIFKKGNNIYISHAFYPSGRYDPHRIGKPSQGRIKKGRIEGRTIHWLSDINPGFTPDYSNIVEDATGYFWVFTRESQQGIAYRSRKPNEITQWMPRTVCIPEKSRHAIDVATLDEGKLYAASMLTPDGKLYGNLYDCDKWESESALIDDNVTTVAGDDRRLSLEFDPTQKRLHLLYVDAHNKLRYRYLDTPYHPENWNPNLSNPALELTDGVFTSALSIDTSQTPYGLVIIYGVEKYLDNDNRFRTGELYARRFDGNEWQNKALLLSQPDTILNWYPNVNQDASNGLCIMYSRSLDKSYVRVPLAIMVSVIQ